MKHVVCVVTVAWLAARVAPAAEGPADWPPITRECRPWAYNWWPGSAVDRENLARELRRYRDGGLGGIHIIPIYGARGAEARYIEYLSPKWMEMLAFAIDEAAKLDLGVDLTTGTGWCFGGPCITKELAGWKVVVTNGVLAAAPAAPKVKRAGPGGEGPMLNPFDPRAMKTYLQWFTPVFDAPGAPRPRAMYHDSYEYFGPNWSDAVPAAFEKRHGYRLADEAEAFAGKGDPDRAARMRCDYRETLSEIQINEVFAPWAAWCRERGMRTRNEAHGAPCNLLDFYAIADIPETEMFARGTRDPLKSGFDGRFGEGDRNPLVSKFASSAAHVAGRPLTAAESCTWMAEHFCETPEEFKCFIDLLFLSGVNHVFYHGCVYSPDDAAWPGWFFYASSQMSPRNPLWRIAPALNAHIGRCQSVLQSGRPDNDVLLYWPIHETWSTGGAFQFTVHSREWLQEAPVGRTADWLWTKGFGFDYVSDRLLAGVRVEGQALRGPGGNAWRAIVVPPARLMPDPTLARLLDLAEQGATVVFEGGLPEDVPGLGRLEERRARMRERLRRLPEAEADGPLRATAVGRGHVLTGPLDAALARAGLRRETLVDHPGARFIRRTRDGGRHYLIVNHGMTPMEGWCALSTPVRSAVVMDPLGGAAGKGELRRGSDGTAEIRLRIDPGHSLILRTFETADVDAPPWRFPVVGQSLAAVSGPWKVEFIAGGPELPKPWDTQELKSWTLSGDPAAEAFGGTAVYRATFDLPPDMPDTEQGARNPESADSNSGQSAIRDPRSPILLDLGDVRCAAKVTLNGRELGTLLMRPYRVAVPAELLKPKGNNLEIEVTNLAANRIRDLDRRKAPWKIMRDINIVNINYKPFDASSWPVFESGLLGPVTLRTLAEEAVGAGGR